MERLTNHFDYCKMIDCKFYDAELYKQGKCNFFDKSIEHCSEKRMNDKLREYEDAEEQGLLLKLPCKVGDTAYYIHREYLKNADKWINKMDEVEVDSFVVNINLFVNVSLYIGCERFGKILTPYKTLFFTKEEAEKALKRMG